MRFRYFVYVDGFRICEWLVSCVLQDWQKENICERYAQALSISRLGVQIREAIP